VPEIAKCRIIGCALKLRVVYYQSHAGVASCCGKDDGRFDQSIGYGVGEICASHIFESPLNCGGIEEIALEDFRALLAEFIRPGIELMDECTNGNALLEQKLRDNASG